MPAGTGGAHTARKLYTDADEMVLRIARPSIVNGINSVAVNADLLESHLGGNAHSALDPAQ